MKIYCLNLVSIFLGGRGDFVQVIKWLFMTSKNNHKMCGNNHYGLKGRRNRSKWTGQFSFYATLSRSEAHLFQSDILELNHLGVPPFPDSSLLNPKFHFHPSPAPFSASKLYTACNCTLKRCQKCLCMPILLGFVHMIRQKLQKEHRISGRFRSFYNWPNPAHLNQQWGDAGLHRHFSHSDDLFLGLKAAKSIETRTVWAILGPTWVGSMAGCTPTAPRQAPLLPEEHNDRHVTASRKNLSLCSKLLRKYMS